MDRIVIGKETFFIEAPERFAWILEEKLGADAARYFRETIADLKFDSSACSGECDETYRIEEHYQRVIRDAVEELENGKVRKLGCSWTSGKIDPEAFARAIKMLNNA